MTVGYGEVSLPVKWAKIFRASRSHTGKFHAWLPVGHGPLCGGSEFKDKPSRFTRDYAPVRACLDCKRKAGA